MKIKNVFLTLFVISLQILESVQNCRVVNDSNGVDNYICDTIQDLEKQGNPYALNVTITNGKTSMRSLSSKPTLSITLLESVGITNEIFGYIKDLSNLLDAELKTLTNSAFGSLPLKSLQLNEGHLEKIEPGAFSRLTVLTDLYIVNNFLTSVTNGVFNNLNLETLALSNNNIRGIENGAFSNMKNLRHLYLDRNYLVNLNSDGMNYKNQLESLYLQSNSIRVIFRETFKGFDNLRVLDLSNNRIDRIINYSFEDLLNLESLFLANNYLRELNAEFLPSNGFPYLSKLAIGNNHLSYLTATVLEKVKHVKLLSIAGNPWQCSCLDLLLVWIGEHKIDQVCDGDYFKGVRPICVVGRSNRCNYFNNNLGSSKYNEENSQFRSDENCSF